MFFFALLNVVLIKRMEYDAFQRNILEPLNLEPNEAHDWILRNSQYMKIFPTETNYKETTVKKYSLENHNIDAMTLSSQSYIYCTATIKYNVGTSTAQAITDHSMVIKTQCNTDKFFFAPTTVPAGSSVIDGIAYYINGQPMDNVPNRLQ